MKKNNNIRPTGLKGDEKINRMKSLMGIKESVQETKKGSVIELTKMGPDDKVYAIVRENHKYFIKIANKKDNLITEDFQYIGGLKNLNEGSYTSYSKAAKQLNLKFISLSESLGFKKMINVLKNDNLTEAFESYNENPKPSQPDTTLGTVKTMGKNDGHDSEIIGDAGETGGDVPTPPVVEEDEAIDEDAETVTEEEIMDEEVVDEDAETVTEEAQMGKPRTATSDVTMGNEVKPPNTGDIDGQTAPIVVEDEAIDEDAETVTEDKDPEYGLYNSKDNEGENDNPWEQEDEEIKKDQDNFVKEDEEVELNENEKAVDRIINGLKNTNTNVVKENKLSILKALQKINEGADSQKKKI